jgi:hypothetical protein
MAGLPAMDSELLAGATSADDAKRVTVRHPIR